MRITNQMVSGRVGGNLSTSMERIYQLQTQLSSMKRINSAADDPAGVAQALGYRTAIASVNQYTRNAGEAKTRLSIVDSALGNINTALTTSKGLIAAAGNLSAADPARQTLADQILSQRDLVLSTVSTQHQGKYVFGGFVNDAQPVTATGAPATPYQYNGDNGELRVPVNDVTQIGVTVTAREVLNFDGAIDPTREDVATLMTKIADEIRNSDRGALTSHAKQLDQSTQQITALRGRMGARLAQVEIYTDYLGRSKDFLAESLSAVEDTDLASTLTQLQSEQNVYQAALYATRTMSGVSLLDYLR